MLMSRPQYSQQNVAKLQFKMNASTKMQQQHHVNQLLSTAAAATGIVGDVDALLTPINTSTQRIELRPERNLWRTDEIMEMLNIMQELNAIDMLNDKTIKSEKVFRDVEQVMFQRGYCKKTHVQIWTKWKFLKSTYTTSRRNGITPKVIPYQIYEIMHKMLSAVNANGSGVGISGASECGNSTTSMDGDNSNGVGGRIVIAGVEGGYNNGVKKNGHHVQEDAENGLDMAHPIFGFRLGLIKPEPPDTGYETITNNGVTSEKELVDESTANSTCSTATNNNFQTEIKQEIIETEETITSASLTAQQTLQEQKEAATKLLMNKRAVRITPIPAIATPNANTASGKMLQLPPLRIAPFAKDPTQNTSDSAQSITCPPPPLSMHPGSRPLTRLNNPPQRVALMQRKLLPKPLQSAQAIGPLRLPKDITVQQARAAADGMPRLKQVPMRKTPYSLRPDRMIPDLDESTSPPLITPTQHQQYKMYAEQPSTSRQAMITLMKPALTLKKRKRRLDIPWTPATSIPAPKMSRTYASQMQRYQNNMEDESYDDDSTLFDSSISFGQRQQKQPQQQQQQQQQQHKAKCNKRKEEQAQFENAMKSLGTSLRQMQRDMMKDFFEKQMELARQEHEFQLQQDELIMQTFQAQMQQIMKSAKTLLGVDLTDLKMVDVKESACNDHNGDDSKQIKQTSLKDEHASENMENTVDEMEQEEEEDENGNDRENENDNEEEEEEDDEDEDEEDDEDEDDAEDEDDDNEQQLVYDEDGDYLQHNNVEMEAGDNVGDTDAEDSIQSTEDDNENVADPIQLVSSELVED